MQQRLRVLRGRGVDVLVTAADAQLTPGRRRRLSAVMMVVVALDLGIALQASHVYHGLCAYAGRARGYDVVAYC